MTQSNLLDLLIGALETAYTLMINPDPDAGLCALLHGNEPVFMRVHTHDVVGMALEELLLPGHCVLADEDAACAVVDLGVFEDQVGVV